LALHGWTPAAMDGQTPAEPGAGLAELFQHVVNDMKVYTHLS